MPQPQQPFNRAGALFGRDASPRLADFTADLLWPRIFQMVGLALKPERLGLAFFGLVAAMAVGAVSELFRSPDSGSRLSNVTHFVLDGVGSGFSAIAAGIFSLSGGAVAAGFGSLAGLPARTWDEFGWLSLLLLPAGLGLGIAGCAICRMAACDFSQGVLLTWTDGAAFAARKTGALVTSFLAPLIVVGAIAAGLAVGGILLGWPGANVVGALLYGLFLIGAAVAVFLLVCWALGFALLIPAIACEGSDGLDAIQRAYAYVLGRPLRLLVFAGIALLLGWVGAIVASLLGGATVGFAEWTATGFSGADGATILAGQNADGSGLTGVDALASGVARFWVHIVGILVWSVALSLFFCGSTVVYLLIRQVADGQDVGELWMPGMIEGTMAQAMEARAAASGAPSDGATRLSRADPPAPAGTDEDDDA